MTGYDKEFDAENAAEFDIPGRLEAAEENDENLRITDESIAIVAGVSATEVDSVARMSVGLAGGIAEALGRQNLAKGVKVEMVDDCAVIDLYVIVNYGKRVSDIAWKIQEHVKENVEKLTGVIVSAVNIHIQGIEFGTENDTVPKTEAPSSDVAPRKSKTRDMSVFQFFDDVDD